MLTQKNEYLPFGRPSFTEQEYEAVVRILKSGWIGQGVETEQFELELAEAIGAPHAILLNSCTSALFLSLRVLGIGPGDEVLCPSLTWCSTANVALYLGADIAFCDVDEATMCVTPETVSACVTPRTKAVIAVHYGGWAVDIEGLRAALPPNIAIVEDAAHALGARYASGAPVGSSENLTCFSFYANKNISTGEGGLIATRSDVFAERLRSLRQSGLPANAWKRFTHPLSTIVTEPSELGYKMNYTDIQASIGRIQLRRFPEMRRVRSEIAQKYIHELPEERWGLLFQDNLLSDEHAKHLIVCKLPLRRLNCTRDNFIHALRARGIGATLHYFPLHLMSFYMRTARPTPLPVTTRLGEFILTLPISASMSLDDAARVVKNVRELLDEHKR